MKTYQYINCLVSIYFAAIGFLYIQYSVSILWIFLGVLLWIGILSWGSFDIRLNVFVKAISSNRNITTNSIAITFDDGPTAFTPEVLAVLKAYHAKATFFCIGKQVEAYPDVLKQILAEGHTIGNHTYTHTTKMGFLSTSAVLDEIITADKVIQDVIGYSPIYYRPPFGVTNPNISKALTKSGHTIIGWNIRSLDTVIESELRIFERVKNKIKPGAIVLFHDTSEKSVEVLKLLLAYLKQQNYNSITIDQLVKRKNNEKDI